MSNTDITIYAKEDDAKKDFKKMREIILKEEDITQDDLLSMIGTNEAKDDADFFWVSRSEADRGVCIYNREVE
jgi:hypothetical protein